MNMYLIILLKSFIEAKVSFKNIIYFIAKSFNKPFSMSTTRYISVFFLYILLKLLGRISNLNNLMNDRGIVIQGFGVVFCIIGFDPHT